jgi:peptide chain release factor 2
MPELPDEVEVNLNPEDLRIDTFRSGGAGGQHVNKTDSAVRITHLPTGIVVQCQNERSQHANRQAALKILKARLFELKSREQAENMQKIKGEHKEIAWGNQIRSYVLNPFSLIKDHRTGVEAGNVEAVLNGDINQFISAYLQAQAENMLKD